MAVVLEREKVAPPVYVAPEKPLTKEELARIRSKLSEFIKQFWSSPEGQILKNELSRSAKNSGWADYMESLMKPRADEMRKVAERLGLHAYYKRVWGKE